MPPVDNDISVTYGGSTIIGGSSGRVVLEWSEDEAYEGAAYQFIVVVGGLATAAAANTEYLLLMDTFRDPDQVLLITLEGQTYRNYDPAANTGFNTRATISKPGSEDDTSRSRRFVIAIEVGLPADLAGRNGRQDSRTVVTYSSSRRRDVAFSGTYTALVGNGARAQYEASVAAFIASKLTAISATATFELVTEDAEEDDQDKILTFNRIYREVIANEGSGTLDDPEIVDQVLQIERTHPSRDSFDRRSRRLVGVTLVYDASIDATLTTNLVAKWRSIRSFLLAQMRTIAAGTVILIEERPTFDVANNRISAIMTAVTLDGSKTLEMRVTQEDIAPDGKIFTPVWSKDPDEAHVDDGPRVRLRTITVLRTVLATPSVQAPGRAGAEDILDAPALIPGAPKSDGKTTIGWVRVERRARRVPTWRGVPGVNLLGVVEEEAVAVWRRVKRPTGGSR